MGVVVPQDLAGDGVIGEGTGTEAGRGTGGRAGGISHGPSLPPGAPHAPTDLPAEIHRGVGQNRGVSISQPVIPPASSTPVRAVLLDADGVLQLIGTPWGEALTRGGGPAFAQAMIDGETDALAGRETLIELLERVVKDLGLELRASDLLEMWHRATPDPLAWQLVRDLREAGYTTVLATNQQWERRAWMREHLGYDGLCDIDGYSCTLGVAKPDAAYFQRLLELAGVKADQALFVDDSATNIAAAREVGLRTIHHPADAGGELLRREVTQALTLAASPSQG